MMTDYGIYVPSILEDLEPAFKKYCPYKRFLDVGSGNGSVMELAFKHGSLVRGVEIEKEFADNSKFKEHVSNKCFSEIDFRIYNIIYYFMKGTTKEKELIKKINNEANGLVILNTNGSSLKEIAKFTSKLRGSLIDKMGTILVYSFTTS